MFLEAGSKGILELLLLNNKSWRRLDPTLAIRLERTINRLLNSETIEILAALTVLDLKFYNDHYQVRVDGNYRLWFTVGPDGTLKVEDFDEGNH